MSQSRTSDSAEAALRAAAAAWVKICSCVGKALTGCSVVGRADRFADAVESSATELASEHLVLAALHLGERWGGCDRVVLVGTEADGGGLENPPGVRVPQRAAGGAQVDGSAVSHTDGEFDEAFLAAAEVAEILQAAQGGPVADPRGRDLAVAEEDGAGLDIDVQVGTADQGWYTTKTHPSYPDILTKLRRTLIAAQYCADLPGNPTPEQIHIIRLAWENAAA